MCPLYVNPVKSKAVFFHYEVFIYYTELLTVIYEGKTTCGIQCDALNHNQKQNKSIAFKNDS